MLGGEMKVDSVYGEGSEFSFTIKVLQNTFKKHRNLYKANSQEFVDIDEMKEDVAKLQFKWRPKQHKTNNITLKYVNDLKLIIEDLPPTSLMEKQQSVIMDEQSI